MNKMRFTAVMLFFVIVLAGITTGIISCGLPVNPGGTPDETSPFGFHPAGVFKPGYSNSGYADAQSLGIKWAREVLYAFWSLVEPDRARLAAVYDFSKLDAQWKNIPAGINIVANIAPEGAVQEGYTAPGSYLPANELRYRAFVKATVERYDGDGIRDMPGLTNPIKYWQVGNEPSEMEARDFAGLQRITYTAVKEACPDCTVLIGGSMGYMGRDYIQEFTLHYKPILAALKGNYVDVMDFHWYGHAKGDYRNAKAAYDHIRSVLKTAGFGPIPIWITETGSYSGDPAGQEILDYQYQTEREQALDYVKRFVYPLSFGVKKIFSAFGLMEGFKNDDRYFDHTGLIYDGLGSDDLGLGVKKLGYYTFRKMTETLEGSDLNNIQQLYESEHVYIYRFYKKGIPLYVAWWDYFNDPVYNPQIPVSSQQKQVIVPAPARTMLATEALPKFSTGREVADYASAFNQYTLKASSGNLTLRLGDSPLYLK